MEASSPLSLQRLVHRTLALRLMVMALVIGLVTAILVYLSERHNLRAQVVEESRGEIHRLLVRTARIMDAQGGEQRAAFRQALDERLAVAVKPHNGEFVYVNFYRIDTSESEDRLDGAYPWIDGVTRFARSLPRVAPEPGREAGLFSVEGRLHVWVVVPLTGAPGPQSAFAQAVFAPSESTLQAIRQTLRRSVLLAVLIVAATSGLLYPVILQLVRKLSLFSCNLLEANLGTLSLLASAIAKRDSDTDDHNFRVTLYAVRLAEVLRVDNPTLQTLVKGAFLHDVGKIGVRDEILLKPGRLDAEEFALMREHVRHGLDIIGTSPWLADAVQVVGGHHERFDGSGYPAGLAGEAIPLVARIFAVADVFDALTSKRPYKEPFAYEAAMALLRRDRGRHFDPVVLDAFSTIAQALHQTYAGRDHQGLRDELQAVLARVFSRGEIVLD